MLKRYLLAPGPTQVPPEVLLAMARPIIHHRAPEFATLFGQIRQDLKWLFQTEADVLTLVSSGTGGMEAAVSNFLSPGEKALYPSIKAVYVQASETSTGVAHDTRAIAEIVRNREQTILVVDAITALGVFDLKTDAWGIDVLVAGSQKALMLPPGLAFISVSDKAWSLVDKAKNASFYFNLKKEREAQQKNQTAYTAGVSLMIGLKEVLTMLRAEGLGNVFSRHARMAQAMREGMKAAGLALFPKQNPSDALTVVSTPDGVDGQAVYKNLREQYGITAAGGQDHLKGKIFRISHMGYIDTFDVIQALAATEMVLKGLGYPIKLGAGVGKAEELLCQK